MIGRFRAKLALLHLKLRSPGVREGATATLTVSFVALYAWLASSIFIPHASFSPDIISGAVVKRGGRLERWSDTALGATSAAARARASSSDLAAFVAQIGKFSRPLELMVDLDEPLRWLISRDRIEIGVEALKAEGVFEKALLKAWVLQSASPEILRSAVRVEAVSDALLAMFRGGLRLEDPRTKTLARYSRSASFPPWHAGIVSFRRACETGWAPSEMSAVCGSRHLKRLKWTEELSAIGSRPVLGELIWRSYLRLSSFGRLRLLRDWSERLRSAAESHAGEPPGSIVEWRDWLREEFRFLLPKPSHPADEAERALAAVETEAQLRSEGPVRVDFAIRVLSPGSVDDGAGLPLENALVERRWTGIALGGDGLSLLPGHVRVKGDASPELAVSDLIWQACEAPTLAQVAGAIRSKRILFVLACGSQGVDYRPYLRMGGEAFARANPSVPFIQMHRASIQYLVARGLKRAQDSVLSLIDRSDGVLARAHLPTSSAWLSVERAYKVAGPLPGATLYRWEGLPSISRKAFFDPGPAAQFAGPAAPGAPERRPF